MMEHDHHLPLPERQYGRCILIFSIITLISLSGAFVYVLWNARLTPTWQEAVVLAGLLAQIGLYIWMGYSGRANGLTERKLAIFFSASLAIWLVEFLLYPEIFWLVYLYIGQMFGMLRLRIALSVSIVLGLFTVATQTGWRFGSENTQDFLVGMGYWAFILVFMVYINQVGRTSQERAQLINKLKAAQQELEAAQQQKEELAVLHERERLARDLHDSLGHALVAISVQLEAIQRLYKVEPVQASNQIDELKALTRASMEDLRRSIAGLRAAGLGERSLCQTLQADCVEFGVRSGVEIDCRVDSQLDRVRPALAETVWRVVQEALTNVEKHAQASKVSVAVELDPQDVYLRIADDGVGLPQDAESKTDCYGLRGMRERVEALGGSLVLDNYEAGTLVEVVLPWDDGEMLNSKHNAGKYG
jgi:signal transduction histidine kinase